MHNVFTTTSDVGKLGPLLGKMESFARQLPPGVGACRWVPKPLLKQTHYSDFVRVGVKRRLGALIPPTWGRYVIQICADLQVLV